VVVAVEVAVVVAEVVEAEDEAVAAPEVVDVAAGVINQTAYLHAYHKAQ
jgi:hypothetical protein